jgi:nucleotide-binding universal stress UspA family protein
MLGAGAQDHPEPSKEEEVTVMRGQAAGRVIVGVDDSLAGMQALREAAGIARQRGMEVLAVRACRALPAGATFDCWTAAGRYPLVPPPPPQDVSEQLAREFVDHAFGKAMGGVPRDVPVHTLISHEPPSRALTEAALHETDLLVIGASRHHPWWPFRRSAGRYCAAHAACPVLIVPPHQGVRELNRTARPWHWLQRRREFSSLTTGISP